jgi:hypothetical protein
LNPAAKGGVKIPPSGSMWRAALTFLIATSAALAQKVSVSHDPQADFAKYKTYKWIDSKNKAQPFAHREIVTSVDQQLAAKGLRKTEGAADLYVVYNIGVDERVTVQGYDYGYGARLCGGDKTLQGKMMVDLIDAGRKELVWRGVTQDTVPENQDKGERLLKKASEKMFKQYPPRKIVGAL